MKYYLHKDTGFYDAYFGRIGKPIPVHRIEYYRAKSSGYYVATKAHNHMSIMDVHIKAQIEAGSHPESYAVEEIRKLYTNSDVLEKILK